MWFKGMWCCLRMQNLLGKCYRSLQKQREPKLVWSCPYFLLGADPEANCLENCSVLLLLTEQTDRLQKKAEEVSTLCAWHVVQRTESSTSRLESLGIDQCIDPLGSVCFPELNWSGKSEGCFSRYDCFLLSSSYCKPHLVNIFLHLE